MELIAFECNLNENCDYFEFQVEYFIEIVYFEELYTYMYTTAKKNYTRDETDLIFVVRVAKYFEGASNDY